MKIIVVALLLPKTLVTKYNLGALRQQRFELSVLEAAGVKGAIRAMIPLTAGGESVPCLFCFHCLPAIYGIPWPVDASLQSLLLPSHSILPLCLSACPNFPLLIRIAIILHLGFTLIQDDLILT